MDYKWTALSVTTVGTFMAGLDARILIIGLPTIAHQLNADAQQVIWVGQAYLLAGTVGLLLIGRVSDIFGRVKLYNIGFIVFTMGSIFCAISENTAQLIGFRLVQGAGFAIIVANSYAIVTDSSPRQELGRMLGINQAGLRLGNVAGLTLSGVILFLVDWRGLFYINIPVGIVGTIWAYKKLREISTRDISNRMDWTGFVLFSSGLTLVLLGITFLSYGESSFEDGSGLVFAGLALIAIFILVESRVISPLLDLRLFRIRSFAMGGIAQLMNSLVFNASGLLLAFYLQIGLGYSPLDAGLALIPLDATYLFFSLWGGRLSDRYAPRVLTTIGLFIGSVSLFVMILFGGATEYLVIAPVIALFGVGNGLFNPTNTRAIMSSVPPGRIGIASGFRQTMFNVGMTSSYGVAVLFITFGIPYSTFSPLLGGLLTRTTLALAQEEFINGFRIAVTIFAIINAVAILPSMLRGKSR